MKYVFFTFKILLLAVAALAYFSMLKVLYCGCWACNTAVAIGVLAVAIAVWDRLKDWRSL